VGVFVAGIARLAWAQDGPGTNAYAPTPASPARVVPPAFSVPVTEAIRLDEYLNRLDQWRNEGRITAADPRGRADCQCGGRWGRSPQAADERPHRPDRPGLRSAGLESPPRRGSCRARPERVRHPDAAEARDPAARPAMFNAAPGYAAVPARDLRRIVKDALETTPLRELPGGTRLVTAIDALPNTAGVRADQTFKELSHLVGDGQEDWLRARVGSFVEDHKLEAGVLAFAAITGLRWASPGSARFMDGLGVRLRILRVSTLTAAYTTGRLVIATATCCRSSTSRPASGAGPARPRSA
jgi:hypothetical protein